MLIDSHAHLMHASFKENIHSFLERTRQAGVEAVINICTNPQELEGGIELARTYPWVYTAASTTPHDVVEEGESAFPIMQKAAEAGNLIAVGETGLDYHYYAASKELQQQFLRRYLRLAKACKLPVIIHCREAFNDLFQILDEEYAEGPGVLHCFTGTLEEAQELIRRGWYLSLSGIVTFKKSQALQQVASTIPLEQLLIETDAPYLAPAPYRGQLNEPAYLRATAQFLADLRAITLEELANTTCQNTKNLFHLQI
jgi:TatD DNase family protein